MTDEQQQHETATTTTQSSLHKLLSVQELISPNHIPMYNGYMCNLSHVKLTWYSSAL